jgi:hypothetical protein
MVLLIAFLILPSMASSKTWLILEDGSGDAPTVQAGIDSAGVGDTVLVMPGRYMENIVFLGKEIVVKSQNGPEMTTLDGSSAVSAVVIISSYEGEGTVLEGFTVTGGRGILRGGSRDGGGIYCHTSSPTIKNNIIMGNEADWGGGMHAGEPFASGEDSLPVLRVEDNVFESNHADRGGGGLRITSSTSVITGNLFRKNETRGGDGGGLAVRLHVGSARVQANTFVENTAFDKGGGIHAHRSLQAGLVTLNQNVLVRNVALGAGNGDSGAGGGMFLSQMRGSVENNTLVNNDGTGESSCGGGGITLANGTTGLTIRRNIIASNQECGVACRLFYSVHFENNLLWQNTRANIGIEPSPCPAEWADQSIFADPLFCDPASDNYALAGNSPALGLGAYPEAACGSVLVERMTWGGIKAKYGN